MILAIRNQVPQSVISTSQNFHFHLSVVLLIYCLDNRCNSDCTTFSSRDVTYFHFYTILLPSFRRNTKNSLCPVTLRISNIFLLSRLKLCLSFHKLYETKTSVNKSHFNQREKEMEASGLGGTVQINRECRKAKEERKERRHRRVERRERKKGVDSVVEEDQQGRGNRKHRSDEEGR